MSEDILKDKRRSWFFYFLKWLLIVGIVLSLLSLVTKPIRKNWSSNYIDSGDVYLSQKKYSTAILEYQKALLLFRGNTKAKERINLSNNAKDDILVLESFYAEKNISAQLDFFEIATDIPSNAVLATQNAKFLLENEEYQLAEIAAKTATELDTSYKGGFEYLKIAQEEITKKVEK